MAEQTPILITDTDDQGAANAYSAGSEIAASDTSSEPLDLSVFAKQATTDIDLTQHLNDLQLQPGVFETDPNRLSAALNAAYPIYLHLIAGGKEAWSEAKRHPHFKGRTRTPKSGTEAIVALSITAKSTRDERGQCSSHATKLVYAAAKKIPPGRFEELMRGVTLEDARKTAAEIRKQSKGKAPKATTTGSRCQVELMWTDKDGHAQRRLGSISKTQREALAGAGSAALQTLRIQLLSDAETTSSPDTGVA